MCTSGTRQSVAKSESRAAHTQRATQAVHGRTTVTFHLLSHGLVDEAHGLIDGNDLMKNAACHCSITSVASIVEKLLLS